MPTEYVTVYQISKQSTDLFFVLLGAISLSVGIGVHLGKKRFNWQLPHWLIPIFLSGFGLLWLWITGTSVLHEDSQALTAYQEGNYQLVEDKVKDFHPMPYEGHQEKCFSVQDERFCYYDYVIAAGFRNTKSYGGPIHSGLPVRIAWWRGVILRLGVPKDQVLTPPESAATINSAHVSGSDEQKTILFNSTCKLPFCLRPCVGHFGGIFNGKR